jgi:hypothetical protein
MSTLIKESIHKQAMQYSVSKQSIIQPNLIPNIHIHSTISQECLHDLSVTLECSQHEGRVAILKT